MKNIGVAILLGIPTIQINFYYLIFIRVQMSQNIKVKKFYVLNPRPRKNHFSSDSTLTPKQKALKFLQETQNQS